MSSFKEQLSQDITDVFMNTLEFAETHSINGKSVECVVMSADKDTPLKYMEGTITSYKSIAVASSLLDSIPQPNDYINFDGTLFKVSTSSEVLGMTYIDLGLPIGKFNRAITIQQYTTTKVNGFPKETWSDFHSCNAYMRNMNADDMLKLGTIVNNQTIFVKMPYHEGITSKMRLVYNSQAYAITKVDNIEFNNEFIDLVCEAVVK